jgi:hypothetical protein
MVSEHSKIKVTSRCMKEILGFDKLRLVPHRYLSRQLGMASINDHPALNPTEIDLPC